MCQPGTGLKRKARVTVFPEMMGVGCATRSTVSWGVFAIELAQSGQANIRRNGRYRMNGGIGRGMGIGYAKFIEWKRFLLNL